MNTSELFDSEVYCGIDTLEIVSDTESTADLSGLVYVHDTVHKRLANGKIQYVVNPDKANDCKSIYHAGLYFDTVDKMICEMELTNAYKSRMDFRFDRFDDGTYTKLLKLNTALLMLVGMGYKCKNRYISQDMLTGEDLTARIQNKYFEMEYYHKAVQEPNGIVDSRLELRSKCLSEDTDEQTALYYWFDKRFEKTVSREQYNELQDILNYYLINRYREELAENPNMKTNEFLHKHRIRILTKRQLLAFYQELGYKNPSESARRYIRTKHLETVSYHQIKEYIKQLKESVERFVNS